MKSLPQNSTLLATNSACPVQAFRTGGFAYGIQYHVEVEPTTVSEWGKINEYRSALESIPGEGGQYSFERAAEALMPLFLDSARRLYEAFSRLAVHFRMLRVA
jgi:GMP synthase-like glutamine amidotransferase